MTQAEMGWSPWRAGMKRHCLTVSSAAWSRRAKPLLRKISTCWALPAGSTWPRSRTSPSAEKPPFKNTPPGVAEPSGGDPKTATAWTLAKPAPWTNLVFTSRTDCAYVSPVTAGDMRVDITRVGDDRIRVRLIPSGGGSSTASVVCPDAPPIPGQPGPALIGTEPRDFELPLAGGTQPFSGGFKDGGDGWTNTGSITVTRQP